MKNIAVLEKYNKTFGMFAESNYKTKYVPAPTKQTMKKDIEKFAHGYNTVFTSLTDKTVSELRTKKLSTIRFLCEQWDIETSPNKETMIERLVSFYQLVKDNTNSFDENFSSCDSNKISDYIFNNGMQKNLSKCIVKILARSPKNVCCSSCSKIVFENFDTSKNPVYDDIIQEISTIMYYLILDGDLTVENGKLVFGEYTDKNGNEKSCFLKLFKGVYTALSKSMNTSDKMALMGDFSYLYDENGNETAINENNWQYTIGLAKTADMGAVLDRSDYETFINLIYEKHPKIAPIVEQCLLYRIAGYSKVEIATLLEKSQNTITKYFDSLSALWDLYGKLDSKSKNTTSETYCTTTCNGGFSASESYEFNYGQVLMGKPEKIKTVKVERIHVVTIKEGKNKGKKKRVKETITIKPYDLKKYIPADIKYRKSVCQNEIDRLTKQIEKTERGYKDLETLGYSTIRTYNCKK